MLWIVLQKVRELLGLLWLEPCFSVPSINFTSSRATFLRSECKPLPASCLLSLELG